MKSLEQLKEKIKKLDSNLAIYKHDLKKSINELKENCNIDEDEIEQYLKKIKKKIIKLEQEEESLYFKADTLLEKIDNARD